MPRVPHLRPALAIAVLAALLPAANGQLFDRLQTLSNRSPVDDIATAAVLGIEGPKSITHADLASYEAVWREPIEAAYRESGYVGYADGVAHTLSMSN